MFRPEKMFRTIVIVPKSKLKPLLVTLQKKAVCQIKESEFELEKIQPLEDEQKLISLHSRLTFVKEHLEKYEEKKKSPIKDFFSSKAPEKIKRPSLSQDEFYKRTEKCLDIIEDSVRENTKQIEKIKEEKNNNEYLISNLQYIPDIKTDSLEDTLYIKRIIGIINNDSFERIKKYLEPKSLLIINHIDKRTSLLIINCLHKDANEIESRLHEAGFDALPIPFENSQPHKIIKRLKEENHKLAQEEKRIVEEMKHLYVSYYPLLEYFHEQLDQLTERIEKLFLMKRSDSFVILECWTPAKNMDAFKAALEKNSSGYYILYEEREDAPALLNNPAIIQPFERITEMYSLPKYGNFDPTPMVAFTFSLFFGFVVSDFFYGLLILLLGMLLIKGKGSYNKKTKSLGTLIYILGISTMINGIIFGSYFGGFLADFLKKFGITIPYLIDPMKQVLIVLVIALVIGVIHISAGLVIGFAENIRKGKFLDGLQAQGVWLLFVSSVMCFLLKLTMPGIILISLSVLFLVGLNLRSSGFAPALLSVFSFAGFTGDVGSYARLMALSVSTGGIALAFNLMANMAAGIPILGFFAAVLIFIIGHVFNILMSCLGGFVHPLRLHFLEHFSKYYDGGGHKYAAFGEKINDT